VAAVAHGLADERRFASSAIAIEIDVAEDLSVACSEGVLTSVLSNLLNNAVRYMGDAPVRRIELAAEQRNGRVHCEVCDSGPGVDPEKTRTLFAPQVAASRSRGPGLGLGLATVKRLVEAHDGSAGYRARRGGGSIFWFDLPCAPAANDAG
jgi:signal transduction histidine kinase